MPGKGGELAVTVEFGSRSDLGQGGTHGRAIPCRQCQHQQETMGQSFGRNPMDTARNATRGACCTPPALGTCVGTKQGTGTTLSSPLRLHTDPSARGAGREVGTAGPVVQYWNPVNQP